MLPDIFLPNKLHLASLIKHFKEYSDIIAKQQQEGIIEKGKDSNVALPVYLRSSILCWDAGLIKSNW